MSVKNQCTASSALMSNLRAVKYSWSAWTCLWIHPFCVLLFAGIIFQVRLTESNQYKLWLWRSVKPYWWNVHLATRRLRRKHGSIILVFSIVRNILSCVLSILREIRTQDFKFPSSRKRYLYFCSKSSCKFEYFDFPVTVPNLHVIVNNCCVFLNFDNLLALRILCIKKEHNCLDNSSALSILSIKEQELSPSVTDSLVKKLSNYHRFCKFCLFGSSMNQRLAIRREF